MRRAARVDSNQRDIVAALQRLGWQWLDLTRAGDGCPDGVVERAGVVRLVEFKAPKGKLTIAQEEVHKRFTVHVLRNVADAIELQ